MKQSEVWAVAIVPKANMGSRIGRLNDQDIVRLNRAVLVYLGLRGPEPN